MRHKLVGRDAEGLEVRERDVTGGVNAAIVARDWAERDGLRVVVTPAIHDDDRREAVRRRERRKSR